MAFEGVSIDIMHNVLIVTNGLTQSFIAKSLKISKSSGIRCFCKRVRKKKHGLIKTQKPCHKCGNIRHEWDLIMLKLLLVREIKTKKQTHGRLFKIGTDDKREFICYTLEDKERLVKIKGETAIPTGKYTVIVTMSPRLKKNYCFNFKCT